MGQSGGNPRGHRNSISIMSQEARQLSNNLITKRPLAVQSQSRGIGTEESRPRCIVTVARLLFLLATRTCGTAGMPQYWQLKEK